LDVVVIFQQLFFLQLNVTLFFFPLPFQTSESSSQLCIDVDIHIPRNFRRRIYSHSKYICSYLLNIQETRYLRKLEISPSTMMHMKPPSVGWFRILFRWSRCLAWTTSPHLHLLRLGKHSWILLSVLGLTIVQNYSEVYII
jgi:hypothetical protein